MSLKLIDIKCIIDNCVQEGKSIGIIANIELTSVIEDLLDSMEMIEKYNVLCLASKIKANGEYLIMINCKDSQYHYYILDYKLNENLSVHFDELHIVSDNSFNTFNPRTIRSDAYSFSPSITIYSNEVDALYDDCDDIDEEDYEEQLAYTDAKWKCPVCCYTCPQTECEYQGDLEECDCDHCLNKKENDGDDKFTFETDVMMPVEECDCCCECDEDKLIETFTRRILETQGCSECIEDLVEELFEVAENIGWDNHKEYIRDLLDD